MTISPLTHTRKRRPPVTPPNDSGPTTYDNHRSTGQIPRNDAENTRRKSVVTTDHGYDISAQYRAHETPHTPNRRERLRVCVEGQNQ